MGKRYLCKFESISKNYLENNFFLLTGFLMTGWFDFVSYGVGLTKLKSKTFIAALCISIILSDLPFVSTGNSFKLMQNEDFNLKNILDGNVPSLDSNYLILFIISVLLIFFIGILGALLNKKYIKENKNI